MSQNGQIAYIAFCLTAKGWLRPKSSIIAALSSKDIKDRGIVNLINK